VIVAELRLMQFHSQLRRKTVGVARNNRLPDRVSRNHSSHISGNSSDGVGWLLPSVSRKFYLGTGFGESFGPPLALPTPILVVGMPKSGTTSIRDFFRCNGHNASHWKCAATEDNTDTSAAPSSGRRGGRTIRIEKPRSKFCAHVIKDNIDNGRPPLLHTGNYEVYAQMDLELPDIAVKHGKPFACYMPQVNDLQALSDAYPHATFILNTRNASHWVHSLRTFMDFDEKLKTCDMTGFPAGYGDTDEEFETFFHQHSQHIRQFVKDHPTHTLVEINIEDPNAGSQLANAFGLYEECWAKRNAGKTRSTKRN
jgi:hypothetical protein